jgi:hypothetical protein
MDASRLTMTFAILLVGVGLGRFVVSSLGQAGDVMASLFVPPDRALGWPHGVQEGDEPWAWHGSVGGAAAQLPIDRGDDDNRGSGDARDWRHPGRGTFVVPVDRVAPVHVGIRPH